MPTRMVQSADEAVILEGVPLEITDRAVWKRLAAVYNKKYGGDVEPMLTTSGGNVYRVEPETAFGQDEHAPHDAFRGPVIGRAVPLAEALHATVTDQPLAMEGATRSEGQRGPARLARARAPPAPTTPGSRPAAVPRLRP